MKKRFLFCMISVMLMGAIAGCQKADEAIGTESNRSDIVENDEEKIYSIEKYGTIEEKYREFLADGTDDVLCYYKMENFFFNDTVSNASSINQTLQQVYDEVYDKYERDYMDAEAYDFSEEESSNTPYSYWSILSLEYVGEDYVSILYNDVSYMGGAHPYSNIDGITIDRKTGEQVFAAQFLGKSDEEILTEISNAMGFDSVGTWDEVDFYITDSTIVFFYRMPGFWEDVVLQRED